MEKLKVSATFFLAASMFSVAGAVIYFTYSFFHPSTEFTDGVAPLLDQTRVVTEELPGILEEIKAIREQIPAVLDEVKATRELIPPVLAEWKATRTETIPAVLSESEAIRSNLPAVLEESEAYRELIPPTLDRLDAIVSETKEVATTAGEGAVTGLFTGIIKAPFSLVESVGEAILPRQENLSASEQDILQRSIESFVNEGEVGMTETFASEDNQFSGSVTLRADFKRGEKLCRELSFTYRKGRNSVPDKVIRVCVDSEGEWSVSDD